MKLKYVIFLFIAVALVTTLATVFFITHAKIIQISKFPMDITVSNETKRFGVNVDPDGLHFGSFSPGNGASRQVFIKDVDEDSDVEVIKKGNISQWVSGETYFFIAKGGERNLTYTANIPSGAETGSYSGELIFIFRKH